MNRRALLEKSALAAPLLLLPRRSGAEGPATFSLMHTNDTHSRIEPFASGRYKGLAGVARRATVVSALRAKNPENLLVDAGDVFQGTTWFNTFKGSVDMEVMAHLGYDAFTVGNHDFDAGIDRLAETVALAPKMVPLAANYKVAGTPLEKRVVPRKIFQRAGQKIGVFGLNVVLEGLVHPRLSQGVTYTDPREAAKEQVALLRQAGCRLVIAISHLGHTGYLGEVGDVDWPRDVAGVDYVVGGHSHTFLEEPEWVPHAKGWKTPVLQVGHSGINLGHAVFALGGGSNARLKKAGALGIHRGARA
jgi:5'-nucleotidase